MTDLISKTAGSDCYAFNISHILEFGAHTVVMQRPRYCGLQRRKKTRILFPFTEKKTFTKCKTWYRIFEYDNLWLSMVQTWWLLCVWACCSLQNTLCPSVLLHLRSTKQIQDPTICRKRSHYNLTRSLGNSFPLRTVSWDDLFGLTLLCLYKKMEIVSISFYCAVVCLIT